MVWRPSTGPAAIASAGAVSTAAATGPVERLLRSLLDGTGRRALHAAQRQSARVASPCRAHLDAIVGAFATGYRAALGIDTPHLLASHLERIDPEHRGFAFEGAGMAVTLLDLLQPSDRRRLARLIAIAPAHGYLLHVGAGWAFARLRRAEGRAFRRLDPLLRWLSIDGMGFHEGFFRSANPHARDRMKRRLSAYGARVFDQGVGRSLWFTTGADVRRLLDSVDAFTGDRRPDVWSGVGLACGYAGGVDDGAIRLLGDASGHARADLAQGVAFAAEARVRAAGVAPPHTERATRIICGMSAAEASARVRGAAELLTPDAAVPGYEVWRMRVRLQLDSGTRPDHDAVIALRGVWM
jgi:enediyne biosynthesis protein E3